MLVKKSHVPDYTWDIFIFLLLQNTFKTLSIMKKLLLLFVVIIMTSLSVNAQFASGTWSVQPKIGIGAANLTNIEDLPITGTVDAEKTLAGAALLGADLEYQMGDKISFSLGLNYSLQGCAWENFKYNSVKYKNTKVELGYINFPIVASYHIGNGLSIKGGLQFGVLTSANFKMETEGKLSGYDTTIDTSIDIKKDYESIDISIPVGISYETKKHLVFDARYQLGLTKVNNEGKQDYKNSVFMITAGYKIKL